ncbi:MAG: indole-3-glycerol-phosphate synthase, partial [Bdellovibrionales bacterium]|nr:indole-3-glycerol-phosphate synthase [Bdellovibrionales bacterium]
MSILEEIVLSKREEVAERKELCPIKLLERSLYFTTRGVSLKQYLLRKDRVGIIAEFKRRSPSRGDLLVHASVEEISIGYMQAGASALSILTDKKYFGGSGEDLTIARRFNFCPVLRKDFIVDEYQLFEAKSWGADAVLLIAAILDKDALVRLAKRAVDLGLEVLFEVHSERDLAKLPSTGVEIVGVNNRDLDTLEVSLETSRELVS